MNPRKKEGVRALKLKPITRRDLTRLRRYYENCDYVLCEYSATIKLMLREQLHPMWAEAAGCLIVGNIINGKLCFDYPVPGPDGDELAALDAIEQWCLDQETQAEISVVPAAKAPLMLSRYPIVRVRNHPSWRDYVYLASDLRDFAGRHYAGQRNHVNKFRSVCPDAIFRILGAGDGPLVDAFFRSYEISYAGHSEKAMQELKMAERMMQMMDRPCFLCGGMYDGEKLLSLVQAEVCGETLMVHIERALPGYDGVYPATVQATAQHFAQPPIRWINREDDADDKGLRTSKRQYRPAFLADKYCFDVENELFVLPEPPTIRTARLTLSALTDADRDAYNRLCLDDERNRWWGYDYRKDWSGEPLEDYFLSVARADFERHTALNLAVRLDGKCIGEVVFYRFTGRGSAELGCRIAPEYAGNGYGAEAFAAAADWGLYSLMLSAITAKCYKENQASYRMLSACMRRTGEDDTFIYFRKEV